MSKEYNCPDCVFNIESCKECPRYKHSIIEDPIKEYKPIDNNTYIPKCCVNCRNHPSNNPNASGICNCALPYMENPSSIS